MVKIWLQSWHGSFFNYFHAAICQIICFSSSRVVKLAVVKNNLQPQSDLVVQTPAVFITNSTTAKQTGWINTGNKRSNETCRHFSRLYVGSSPVGSDVFWLFFFLQFNITVWNENSSVPVLLKDMIMLMFLSLFYSGSVLWFSK